jgi:DedD protein
MGLFDKFFHRDRAGATPVTAAEPPAMTGEQAQDARARARRRLIGAMVLLGVGVIAFPLLFETQPRPIPVDIPIVIPPRDGAAPLALPAPKAMPSPAAPAAVAPASASMPPVATAPAPAPVPAPIPAPPSVPSPQEAKPALAPAPKPAPTAVASTPKPSAEAPAAAPAPSARFVVQIGAFAEAAAVRDVRAKAQKAGVSTFTQVVETSDGKRTRVRVGPFDSREAAEKAAAQIKAAGLPGSVLTL